MPPLHHNGILVAHMVTPLRWTLVGVLILLIAAFARIWMLGEAPPGLQHDEIFKAQEGIALIEHGDFRLFYPSNQGHESGYVWVLALAYALFGKSVMMVKFPPLVFGLLTVALMYRVLGEIFNRRVGVIAAGLTAVSFWGVFTSRVGLRAVMLPVITLLVIWGVHRLYRSADTRSAKHWCVTLLTAFALGFAIYTYTSSFVLYIAFFAIILALIVFDRVALRRVWKHLAVIGLIATVMTLPMINVRLNDPQGQNRVSTITRPLNDFLAGKPAELIDNAWKLAGMPFFTGDPEWRYNVADRPLFATPVGLLVYVGLAVAVWRLRKQPILAIFLTLATAGLIPSLLTVSAPSFLRSIIALPAIMLFVALVLDALRDKRMVWSLGVIAVVVTGATDWSAYFGQWPRNEEVQSIYRDDLEQLAHTLNEQDTSLVLVSTTDTELDPLLFRYYQPPEATEIVFFDGRTNIALSHNPERNALLVISPWSPVSPPHADWLAETSGTTQLEPIRRQDGQIAFDVYQLDPSGDALRSRLERVQTHPVYIYNQDEFPAGRIERWAQQIDYPVNFGGIVELVGVELPRTQIASQFDGVNLQLYFRPLVDHPDIKLNAFVHMSTRGGVVHAQRDLMGIPALQWTRDLVFIQDNFVIAGATSPGSYIITMGVYDYATGERLPILNADGEQIANRLIVGRVQVVE